MLKPRKRNLELPQEVRDEFELISEYDLDVRNAYMRLLRDGGWTLQSIADAVGDISRERVRQCIDSIDSDVAFATSLEIKAEDRRVTFPVPDPPVLEPRTSPRVVVDPSPETLARLKELKPLASKVRYGHSSYRDEAEEYVELLWHAHTVEGVSVYRLGQLLGTQSCGIQSRFVRYGYKTSNGASKSFSPIKYRKAR